VWRLLPGSVEDYGGSTLPLDDRFNFRGSCISTVGRSTAAQIRRGHA
jgi:hypothetical protein